MSLKSFLPLLMGLLCGVGACDEPLKGEGPSEALQACCQAASSRIATVNDVESANFRKRCEACRQKPGGVPVDSIRALAPELIKKLIYVPVGMRRGGRNRSKPA